jgi:hypothetical protein
MADSVGDSFAAKNSTREVGPGREVARSTSMDLFCEVNRLNAAAWALKDQDLHRTLRLSEKARRLASETQPNLKGQAESLRNLG